MCSQRSAAPAVAEMKEEEPSEPNELSTANKVEMIHENGKMVGNLVKRKTANLIQVTERNSSSGSRSCRGRCESTILLRRQHTLRT